MCRENEQQPWEDEPMDAEGEDAEPEIKPDDCHTDCEALAEAKDRHLRVLADFDNFRKRTAAQIVARYDDGIAHACEKLLPIIDNFERAAANAPDADDAFYQGIILIWRQLQEHLTDLGVAEICADIGTQFDPKVHHAVSHITDDAHEQNVITQVLQKGYATETKILRPAMVQVAN